MIDIEYIELLLSKVAKVDLHSNNGNDNSVGALKLSFDMPPYFGASLIHYLSLKFEDKELSLTIKLISNDLQIIFKSHKQDTSFKLLTDKFDNDYLEQFFEDINYVDSTVFLACYAYGNQSPIVASPITVVDKSLPKSPINGIKVKIYSFEP